MIGQSIKVADLTIEEIGAELTEILENESDKPSESDPVNHVLLPTMAMIGLAPEIIQVQAVAK